jgi:hypothetical protein
MLTDRISFPEPLGLHSDLNSDPFLTGGPEAIVIIRNGQSCMVGNP